MNPFRSDVEQLHHQLRAAKDKIAELESLHRSPTWWLVLSTMTICCCSGFLGYLGGAMPAAGPRAAVVAGGPRGRSATPLDCRRSSPSTLRAPRTEGE